MHKSQGHAHLKLKKILSILGMHFETNRDWKAIMFSWYSFILVLLLLPILYTRDSREANTGAELQTPKGFAAHGYLSIFISPYTVVRLPTQTPSQCHARLSKSSLRKENVWR